MRYLLLAQFERLPDRHGADLRIIDPLALRRLAYWIITLNCEYRDQGDHSKLLKTYKKLICLSEVNIECTIKTNRHDAQSAAMTSR